MPGRGSPSAVLDSTAALLTHRLAIAQTTGRLPSLVAGVVRGNDLAWTASRGARVRRRGEHRPDAGTQYRVGSITKTMTAVLVLQLRDEGLLDLADPLAAHLPDAPYAERSIRALLAHTGGVAAEPPGPWWERNAGRDWEQLSRELRTQTGVLPPGRQYHYSNVSYALLGELVARLRDRPWQEVLTERVLQPLAMARTSYLAAEPSAEGFSVHPYAETLTSEPAHDTLAMAPAGQLWSTVGDLARWAAFLAAADPAVLAPDTVDEMAIVQSADPAHGGVDAYGLGLRLVTTPTLRLRGHTGSMPGFLASVFVDATTSVGAVVLTNATRGLDGLDLCTDLIATVLRCEPVLPPEWHPNDDPGDYAELLGAWYWGNTAFSLSWRAGTLLLESPGDDQPTRFEAVGTGQFRGCDGYFTGELLSVVRGSDAEISHLDLATFVLTRTPYGAERVSSPGSRWTC